MPVVPVVSRNYLKRLIAQREKEAKQQAKINPVSFEVPARWEDFVASIQIRSGGKMRAFAPYEYQIILSNLIDKYSNIVVVKSRQVGTTQLIISKFLHRAALNPAYCGMAFMRRQPDADAIAAGFVRLQVRLIWKLHSKAAVC